MGTSQTTTSELDSNLRDQLSMRVKSAPAPFFPEPPVPIRFNFDQGVPAPESYPIEALADYAARAIRRGGVEACEYAAGGMEEMGRGFIGLREILAERIGARDGQRLTRHNVLLANGSSNALSLCAAALVDPGDGVIVEALSYPFMVSYLAGRGADVRTVPVDAEGMDVGAVERTLIAMREGGTKPKLIYTIPTFQVPTSTVMSLARRQRLIELATAWNVFIVEDNCYYDTYVDEPPPPTLLSLDGAGVVIQTDSFSKTLAPGLRVGFATAHERVIEALATVREDHGVSQIVPRMLELYITDGLFDRHLVTLRQINRRKRDEALAAIRDHCEPWVTFEVPGGGIYFWFELSAQIDWERVRLHMLDEGVACRPGERFSEDPSSRQFLRMAFLPVPSELVVDGVAAMGRALKASLR